MVKTKLKVLPTSIPKSKNVVFLLVRPFENDLKKTSKMKKLILSLLGLAFLSTSLFSQNDETLFGKNGLRLTGAWGGWKSGITTFNDDYAYTRGGFGGLGRGFDLILHGFTLCAETPTPRPRGASG